MLEAITNSCIENWDLVDDYGVDYYEFTSEWSDYFAMAIAALNQGWDDP